MEYLLQIITPHGAALVLLMVISTVAMGRIFSIIADLRTQSAALEELVPRLRAALSTGNTAKAAVAAESNDSCIGRLMAAILREPTRDGKRMRLIYKLNIDDELRTRLDSLSPLRRWGVLALLLGVIGALVARAVYLWGGGNEVEMLKRMLVVGISGGVVFLYILIFFSVLRRKEMELNDTLAAEALNLIDIATRSGEENVAV